MVAEKVANVKIEKLGFVGKKWSSSFVAPWLWGLCTMNTAAAWHFVPIVPVLGDTEYQADRSLEGI